ncbi:MAG: galactokinase [Deltaproteobacteria bacterium]|jgi:D-glycero-alpha-D-manno-heptose-7-phosphate kinase|nr:galactokinase [Deltaproteobacteria bacterium]
MQKIIESHQFEASAPCRIDMGGTLDISTFYYPLRHLFPCTVNIAMKLRTKVRLLPYDKKKIKITSKGFKGAEYLLDKAPFDHPLGLIFAIAAYFRAEGIHIDIDSSSPPRSALGGSSSAAVALVGAFSKVKETKGEPPIAKKNIAFLSQTIEASVAGVPCGFQDQLAAVYGGANVWYWPGDCKGPFFYKKTIIAKRQLPKLEKNLLLAYCGVPHESKDVNKKWVTQFLSGKHHGLWAEIIVCTHKFADALMKRDIPSACEQMNKETAIRRKMTPEVLDEIGKALVESAKKTNCGARFTGAGGGGCIWALGRSEDIDKLKGTWEGILSTRKDAGLLRAKIDSQGLL